jgi:heptosyltransferase I
VNDERDHFETVTWQLLPFVPARNQAFMDRSFNAAEDRPLRILIVRLSSIGDVVLSVPTLCALRRSFPDAKIGWVVESQGAQLLSGHMALNELFTTTKAAFRSASEFYQLSKVLRSWKPDVTIDLQGLAKSSLLAFSTRAKRRLGFAHGDYDGRECSCWINNCIVTPKHSHLVMRGLEILEPLGIRTDKVEFNLPEHEADTQFAKSMCHELCGDRPYAVINVGARWVSRLWPTERYAEVATHLARRWGLLPLILWNGSDERHMAEQVRSQCAEPSVLAPGSTLTQLRSIIRGAKIFVGSDTGPMHLSVAVDTPTIGMIGPMPIERTGPLGPKHRAIQREKLPRKDKSQRRTNCGPILSITVQDIVEACDSILSSPGTSEV